MAGAAVSELVARIIASDEASDTLARVSEQVEATAKRFVASNKRAQEQITALIAKGDPAKQAKIQADKEIEQAQRIAKARPQLAAEAAAAEVAIRQRLSKQLAEIDSRGTAVAVAGQASLQSAAKGAAETVSKVASLANVAGSAFGGMGGAAGQAASSIVGAFGAGGPIAIGIAALGATIAVVATEWSKLKDSIDRAADAARSANEAFRGAVSGGSERAAAALAKFGAKPGDEARTSAGRASGSAADARAEVEKARRELSLQENRGQLEAEASQLTVRTANGKGTPEEEARLATVRAMLREGQGRAGDEVMAAIRDRIKTLEAAIPMLETEAATWEEVARKEDEAAKAAGKSSIGRATGAATTSAGSAVGSTRGTSSGGSAPDFTRGRLLNDELSMFADDAGASAADAAAANLAKAKRARSWFATQNAGIWDESAKASAEEQAANVRDTISDANAWLSAGESAMSSFLDGMRSDKVSDKLKGIASGLLTVLGGALGFVFGGGVPGMAAGAGLGSGIGGLLSKFEDGGPAFAVARRGLGTMPGGNDGIPSILHPGEFTFSAPAVRAMGGIGAAAQAHEALRDGRPGGGGGGSTTINVIALDPRMAAGVIEQSVEPAMTTRLAARQGALYRAELQRAAAGPRSGV